jgi:hypothetical protein
MSAMAWSTGDVETDEIVARSFVPSPTLADDCALAPVKLVAFCGPAIELTTLSTCAAVFVEPAWASALSALPPHAERRNGVATRATALKRLLTEGDEKTTSRSLKCGNRTPFEMDQRNKFLSSKFFVQIILGSIQIEIKRRAVDDQGVQNLSFPGQRLLEIPIGKFCYKIITNSEPQRENSTARTWMTGGG